MNRTDRLYALVEELRAAAPRARSAAWLARRFEVSGRTIERDVAALQQSGVPIWATPGRAGGYTIDPSMTLPPVTFTPGEATAIAVALAAGDPMPFADDARSALRKVVGAMTGSGRERAKALAQRVRLLERSGLLHRGPVVRAVEQAVAAQKVLSIDYVDRHDVVTDNRGVEPYGLAGADAGWYLLGWCRLRQGSRSFRLDRIRAARVTNEDAPPRTYEELFGSVDLPPFRPVAIDE